MSKITSFALVALLVGFASAQLVGFSCAHAKHVVEQCPGPAAQGLIDAATAALAQDDYEAELAKVGAEVAPCLLIATVQEIVASLSGKAQYAGAPTPLDAVVVQKHGREWLAVHGP